MAKGPTLLAAYLKKHSLSQREAELRVGAASGMICRWLSGQRIPSLRFAILLERAFGVPLRAWRDAPHVGTAKASGAEARQ